MQTFEIVRARATEIVSMRLNGASLVPFPVGTEDCAIHSGLYLFDACRAYRNEQQN